MKHIPNILSGFRILLIPVFVVLMLTGRQFGGAVVLLVSGVTDLLDGALARGFGWVSNVGKVLDPAADKLTQIAVCVVMMIRLRRYWYIFAILLCKDAIMLVMGGYLLTKGVKLEGAKWFGKVSTFSFYGVMLLVLFFPRLPEVALFILLCGVALLALVSALQYIPEYIRYKSEVQDTPA